MKPHADDHPGEDPNQPHEHGGHEHAGHHSDPHEHEHAHGGHHHPRERGSHHHEHEPHPHHHEHEHEPHAHHHEPAPHLDSPHPHPHVHAHPHSHSGPRALPRPALPRGIGEGKILFLDMPSGIAGDMTIAALVDLGVPFEEVRRAVACLPLRGFHIELSAGFAGAIGAAHFDVHVDEPQPERDYRSIDALIAAAPLRPRTQGLARAIFRRLAEAEAEVHRVPVEDVHFHEVGAVDAIVDIVGAAACFDFLGADVVASPVPLGRGSVRCRHGIIPLPAPACLLCLRGVPTYDAGIEAELVTPTGAAIVASVATSFTGWPSFMPEYVGWGKGTRELDDRPNALRAVLGEPWMASGGAGSATHVIVEANVDDLTGELAGHALKALLDAGALDAWLTPIQMKKGRPGLIVSALCPITAADRLGAVLLRETSSLGYRRSPVTRGERPRRLVEIETPYGRIPVKVSTGPWGSPQLKPEFDICAERAEAHGVPVREVIQATLGLAREQFGIGSR